MPVEDFVCWFLDVGSIPTASTKGLQVYIFCCNFKHKFAETANLCLKFWAANLCLKLYILRGKQAI